MTFHTEQPSELPADPSVLFNELISATTPYPEVRSSIAKRLSTSPDDSMRWIGLVEMCGQLRGITTHYAESQSDEALLWMTHIEPLRKKMFLEALPHTNMATPLHRVKWLNAGQVIEEIKFIEEDIIINLDNINSRKDWQYAEKKLSWKAHVFKQYHYLENLLAQYSEITGETWEWPL